MILKAWPGEAQVQSTHPHTQFEVSSDFNLVLRNPKLVYNFVVEEQQIPNSRTTRK